MNIGKVGFLHAGWLRKFGVSRCISGSRDLGPYAVFMELEVNTGEQGQFGEKVGDGGNGLRTILKFFGGCLSRQCPKCPIQLFGKCERKYRDSLESMGKLDLGNRFRNLGEE
jgi:hypothetical protein